MFRARAVLMISLLTAAASAFADHYADLYVIPVAGHVRGAGGRVWMSDVAVQNFQASPLNVELVVIESGDGNPDNVVPLQSTTGSVVTIPAGGTRILHDLMEGHSGVNSIGAILIGADRPFSVTSRAYVTSAEGASEGQTVPAVQRFLDDALGDTNPSGATAYLPGLVANARQRTNIGFVAGAGESGLTFEVALRGADGAMLGSRTFSVPPNAFRHVQFSSTSIANTPFDEGSATLRITSGDGAVVPYASVVDNQHPGAFFVTGQFPRNVPFAPALRTSVFGAVFEKVTKGTPERVRMR